MNEKNKNLVIENTRASLVTLPAVTSTDPRVAAGLKILPGQNDVPAWYWEKCLKTKAVKIWVASDILRNLGEGEAKPLVEGLDNLTKNDAIKQIAKCDEVMILRDWKEQSEKAEVKKRCSDKIDDLVKAAGNE